MQFFPHANGMVGRLNPSRAAAAALSTAGGAGGPLPLSEPSLLSLSPRTAVTGKGREDADIAEEVQSIVSRVPPFLQRMRRTASLLDAIAVHQSVCPPSPEDLECVRSQLLPYFVGLTSILSGDDGVDAKMRVYCAYNLPAVVLLLEREGWNPQLRGCFLSLVTGSSLNSQDSEGEEKQKIREGHDAAPATPSAPATSVPLPVKRCLALSFHTFFHILGRDVADRPRYGVGEGGGPALLEVFETHFL